MLFFVNNRHRGVGEVRGRVRRKVNSFKQSRRVHENEAFLGDLFGVRRGSGNGSSPIFPVKIGGMELILEL